MDFHNNNNGGMAGMKVGLGVITVSSDGKVLDCGDSLPRFFPGCDPANVKINDLLSFFGDIEEKEGMFRSAVDKNQIFGVVVKKAPSSCFNVYFHNVTDTKNKLDSLKTNLARLKALESMSHTGYWEYDIKNDEYYLSDELISLFGTERSKENHSFGDFKQYFPPEDYKKIYELSRNSFKTGNPYSFETEIVRKSGETRYVHAKADILKDATGKPETVIGIMMDITRSKNIENELRQNEILLTKAEEIAHLGSYIRDLATDSYRCSKGFFQITGLDPDTFKNSYETMRSITHPEDSARVDGLVEKSIITGNPFEFDNRIIKPDGSIRHIRSKGSVIKDEDGNPEKVLGTLLDITDYKQTENRLLDIQKSLRQAEKLASIGSWTRDAGSFIYQCSEGFCDICGLDPDTEFYSKKEMEDTVHPGDRKYVEAELEKARMLGQGTELEHRVLRPDGTVRFVRSRSTFVYGKELKPLREVGTLVDITRYKEESERLRDAELIAKIGHWEWDVPSDTHIVSEGLLNITGYDSTEDLKKSNLIGKLFHPDDRPRVNRVVNSALISGEPYSYEARIIRPDGGVRWIKVNGLPVKDGEGRVHKTKGTFSDITETKKYQQKLLQNEIRFKQAEEAAGIGHWEKDLATDTYILSDGIYKILGFKKGPGEMSYKKQLSAVHPDDVDYVDRIVSKAKAENTGYKLEHRIIRPDGEVRYVKTDVTLVRDSSGAPTKHSGLVMDVTETVKKEKRRLELESKLRQQQKLESIGLLAGGVAHEINNPINGIMNYGQLILDSEKTDEDVRMFASEIIHESERVSGIVGNLLKFSRQGRKTHIPVEFKDILDRTISLVNMVFKKDNIKIETYINSDLPRLTCNPQEIQQVLLNLITNSRDALNKKYAGEDGNKTVTIYADKINGDEGDFLEIVVEDHGTGIAPDIRDRLFDPFFTTKGQGEGTGLGLSISYGIIEEHGGVLSVESEVGEYTRFHIRLPFD